MSEGTRHLKQTFSNSPTLYLPRLNSRVLGQPSRLYFVSQSGNEYYDIKRSSDEKNFVEKIKTKKFTSLKNFERFDNNFDVSKVSNLSRIGECSMSKKTSKHLKLLFESEPGKLIQNTDRSFATKSKINLKTKFLHDSSYSPVHGEYYRNNISQLNPVNTCSFNSSRFMNTNSELYEESLWAAFDKLQDNFEKKPTYTKINSVIRNKEFLHESQKIRNNVLSQNTKNIAHSEEVEKLNQKFDKSVEGGLKISFKSLDKKMSKIAERLKKIKLSNIIKGRGIIKDNPEF